MNKKLFYSSAFLLTFCGLQAQTKIGSDILGKEPLEQSGGSVSISADGSIVALGAHLNSTEGHWRGAGRVFKNNSGVWTQLGRDFYGSDNEDLFGRTAAISADGTVVAFGAPSHNVNGEDAGMVRIFKFSSGSWGQGADIYGKAANDLSGMSISLSADGSIVAIGSPYSSLSRTQAGQARIYQNINGSWIQIGSDIDGNAGYDRCGTSVSLSADGMTLAVGNPNRGQNTYQGYVNVYHFMAGEWMQVGNSIQGEAGGDLFGTSVSISQDGLSVAIGATENDGNGANSGHVRVYKYLNSIWNKIGNDIDGEAAGDNSGKSVSISSSGSVVAIGAPNNGGAGQTRIYKNIGGSWTKIGNDIDGEYAGDASANSVSLSSNGATVAIGAPLNTQGGSFQGKATVYDLTAVLASDQFVMERTSIYPNPVKNELFIQLKNDLNLQQVNIYTSLGQLIRTEKTSQINVSSFARGFYLVEVVTDMGKATHKALVD